MNKKNKLTKKQIKINKKERYMKTKGYAKKEAIHAIKIAKREAYIKFVRAIKNRDMFTCQISGKSFLNSNP